MDVEEWYDAHCFEKKKVQNGVNSMKGLDDYIALLDKYHIKGTFFLVANRIQEAEPYLKKSLQNGHEIAIHGYQHRIPSTETIDQFKEDLLKTRQLIKDTFGVNPIGYRAPCFSLDENHYQALKETGFVYDCSTQPWKGSRSAYHHLGQATVNPHIYADGSFTNFVLNQGHYFFFRFPMSGGAYARTTEWLTYRTALKHHLAHSQTYVFYVHPFEVTGQKLGPFPTKSLGIRMYFWRGRKAYLKHIEQIIKILQKDGYRIMNFQEYCQTHRSVETSV